MRRNWKRILSLLLTVAMVFTMNTSVFATTVTDSNAPKEETPAGDAVTTATLTEAPATEPEQPAQDDPAQDEYVVEVTEIDDATLGDERAIGSLVHAVLKKNGEEVENAEFEAATADGATQVSALEKTGEYEVTVKVTSEEGKGTTGTGKLVVNEAEPEEEPEMSAANIDDPVLDIAADVTLNEGTLYVLTSENKAIKEKGVAGYDPDSKTLTIERGGNYSLSFNGSGFDGIFIKTTSSNKVSLSVDIMKGENEDVTRKFLIGDIGSGGLDINGPKEAGVFLLSSNGVSLNKISGVKKGDDFYLSKTTLWNDVTVDDIGDYGTKISAGKILRGLSDNSTSFNNASEGFYTLDLVEDQPTEIYFSILADEKNVAKKLTVSSDSSTAIKNVVKVSSNDTISGQKTIKFTVSGANPGASYIFGLRDTTGEIVASSEKVLADSVGIIRDVTVTEELKPETTYRVAIKSYTKSIQDDGVVIFGKKFEDDSAPSIGTVSTLGSYGTLTSDNFDISENTVRKVGISANDSEETVIGDEPIAVLLISKNGVDESAAKASANAIAKDLANHWKAWHLVSADQVRALNKAWSITKGEIDIDAEQTYYMFAAFGTYDNTKFTEILSDVCYIGEVKTGSVKDGDDIKGLVKLTQSESEFEYLDDVSSNFTIGNTTKKESTISKNQIEVYAISKELASQNAIEKEGYLASTKYKASTSSNLVSANVAWDPNEYWIVVSVNGLDDEEEYSSDITDSECYVYVYGSMEVTTRKLTLKPDLNVKEYKVGQTFKEARFDPAKSYSLTDKDDVKYFFSDASGLEYMFRDTEGQEVEMDDSASFNAAGSYDVYINQKSDVSEYGNVTINSGKIEDILDGYALENAKAEYFEVNPYSESTVDTVTVYDMTDNSLYITANLEGMYYYDYYQIANGNQNGVEIKDFVTITLGSGEDVTKSGKATIQYSTDYDSAAPEKAKWDTSLIKTLNPSTEGKNEFYVSANFGIGDSSCYTVEPAKFTVVKQPVEIYGMNDGNCYSYKYDDPKQYFSGKYNVHPVSYNGKVKSDVIIVAGNLSENASAKVFSSSASANITAADIDVTRVAPYDYSVGLSFANGFDQKSFSEYYDVQKFVLAYYYVYPQSKISILSAESGTEMAYFYANNESNTTLTKNVDLGSSSSLTWYGKVNAKTPVDIDVTYDSTNKKVSIEKSVIEKLFTDSKISQYYYDVTLIYSTQTGYSDGNTTIAPIVPVTYDGNNHVVKGDTKKGTADITNGNSKFTVTYSGAELTLGTDYTVTYKNNKNAGYASDSKAPMVIIKGKGDYKSLKIEMPFTILPQDFASAKIDVNNLYFKANKNGVKVKATVYDPITMKKIPSSLYDIYYIDAESGQNYGTKPTALNDGRFHIVSVYAASKLPKKGNSNYVVTTDASKPIYTVDSEYIYVYPSTAKDKFKVKGVTAKISATKGKTVSAGDFIKAAKVTLGKASVSSDQYTAYLYDNKNLVADEAKGLGGRVYGTTGNAGTYYVAFEPVIENSWDSDASNNASKSGVYAPVVVKVTYQGEKLKKNEFTVANTKFTYTGSPIEFDVASALTTDDVEFSYTDRVKDTYNATSTYASNKYHFDGKGIDGEKQSKDVFVEPGSYALNAKGKGSRAGNIKISLKIEKANVKSIQGVKATINDGKAVLYNVGGYSDSLLVVKDGSNKTLSVDSVKWSVTGVGKGAGKVTYTIKNYNGSLTEKFDVNAVDWKTYYPTTAKAELNYIRALPVSTVSGGKAKVKLQQYGPDYAWHDLGTGDYKLGTPTSAGTNKMKVTVTPAGKKFVNTGSEKSVTYSTYNKSNKYTDWSFSLSGNGESYAQAVSTNGTYDYTKYYLNVDSTTKKAIPVQPVGTTLTVKVNGTTYTLSYGTDYVLTYKNNDKVGKATAYVEIINEKLGTIFPIYDSSATTSKTFTIVNQ